jgi:CheY-like chemotaxis protein
MDRTATTDNSRVRRVLVVDDTPSIHADFRKILCPKPRRVDVLAAADVLFGRTGASTPSVHASGSASPPPMLEREFAVDSALQGREGYDMVASKIRLGTPYALIFMDMRMPPGWDGAETLVRIFGLDPDVEAVICTAYSDYSAQALSRLSRPGLRLLPKPFDCKDVLDLAWSLTDRWAARRALTRAQSSRDRP